MQNLKFSRYEFKKHKKIINFTGRVDECETASDIYQCGRDANLPIMDQIYTTEKRDATVVCC
jgi:hypothetical protein